MNLLVFLFIFIVVYGILCSIDSSNRRAKQNKEKKQARENLKKYQNKFNSLEKQLRSTTSTIKQKQIQNQLDLLQQQMANDQLLINMRLDMQNFLNQQNLDMQMQQMNDFMNTSLSNVTPFEMGGMNINQGNSFNDMNNCGGFNNCGGGMGMF